MFPKSNPEVVLHLYSPVEGYHLISSNSVFMRLLEDFSQEQVKNKHEFTQNR